MHLTQPLAGHVSIDFGGLNTCVPQEFLDHTKIGAVLQKVRGKAVPQHVRGNVALDAGETGALLYPQPEGDAPEGGATLCQKNVRGRAAGHESGAS